MKFKIISLVTTEFNKSIVFYGVNGTYVKHMYDKLIENIDIPINDIQHVFRLDRVTIDFNSEYDMFLEDNILNILNTIVQ